jgi:hypothetical protein
MSVALQRCVINEMDTQSFQSTVHGAALSLLPRTVAATSSATLSCDFRTLLAKRESLAQALPSHSMKVAVTLSHARNDTDDMCVRHAPCTRSL